MQSAEESEGEQKMNNSITLEEMLPAINALPVQDKMRIMYELLTDEFMHSAVRFANAAGLNDEEALEAAKEMRRVKILQQGEIPEYMQTVKRFKCFTCGCVFEADKDEYKTDFQYNELFYSSKCPCCGKTVNSVPMRSD